MNASQASRGGSDNSSDSSWEMVEIVGEEIGSSNESLLQQGNDYSFTALNRSLQFLHLSESLELLPHPYNLERDSFTSSPPFPPDSALVEQEANSSVFAKFEPADPDSNPNSPLSFSRFGKRGEGETSKARAREVSTTGSWFFVEAEVSNPSFGGARDAEAPVKKSRSAEHGSLCSREAIIEGEQLSYVHVRARRGKQTTDSHSLAERVRREKINARMKLLTELVPGCNKVSGKALVLDEIINYVQSLQRQVEFLSMRLAAFDPRINNLTGLHNSSSSERGSDAAVIIEPEPLSSREFQVNSSKWSLQPLLLERDASHMFMPPKSSLISSDSSDSANLHANLEHPIL